ncbi:MICOS complex subunit MIC26 [Oryzias melastigma]|uniref:MICOS complex subunit MIC26 n=1 Tax=Oryzias melastigma TaxID=30732 RepID=UPI000CF827D9|nr:MICOS complex subunit MIC26 [Oryzias melastigma]
MFKVTGGAMPGAARVLPLVWAAEATDGGEKEPAAPLKLDDLSLYSAPEKPLYVEPAAGQLEEHVATLRKLVEPYTGWCQVTYGKLKPKMEKLVQSGNDSYVYLQNHPKDFYARAGIIGFTGVLGLFLARGSRVKKLIYPAGLMTLTASMYYPEEAVTIARSTGDAVYGYAVRGFAAAEKIFSPQSKDGKSGKTEAKP